MHIGQGERRRCQRNRSGEGAVEGVVDQRQIAGCSVFAYRHAVDLSGGAVGASHSGLAGDCVAVAQVDRSRAWHQPDARDVLLCQREQLSCLIYAVLVQVLPQAYLNKRSVCRIEQTVAVCIQCCQCLKSGGGVHRIHTRCARQQRVHAKQLAPRIDRTVAVAVEHNPSIIGLDPARADADSVGVVVKQNGRCRDANGIDAVAIEVDGKRIATNRRRDRSPPARIGLWIDLGISATALRGRIFWGLRDENSYVPVHEVIDHHRAAGARHG